MHNPANKQTHADENITPQQRQKLIIPAPVKSNKETWQNVVYACRLDTLHIVNYQSFHTLALSVISEIQQGQEHTLCRYKRSRFLIPLQAQQIHQWKSSFSQYQHIKQVLARKHSINLQFTLHFTTTKTIS